MRGVAGARRVNLSICNGRRGEATNRPLRTGYVALTTLKMLAALEERITLARERLEARLVPVMERLAPALAVASSVYTLCLPYAVKAFHYGFIPMVILLGMQSTPKPKLVDLLTPM